MRRSQTTLGREAPRILPWSGSTAGSRLYIHAAFVAAAVVLAVLFADSYRVLIATWARSGMFQFQFLVPPIVAILIWSRRKRLARLNAAPRYRGLAGVIGVGFIWLLGKLANVDLITDVAVIALVPVLVYSFYGPRITRALTFPLAYLFFAVPFGYFLVSYLQQITAQASVVLLNLTGVPVVLSGNMIHTLVATWHVAEACSGIKFLLATTAFGVLYAHLFYNRPRRRLIFVAFALAVPVIANILRVYFTIMIGLTFGIQYASGTDHLIFGWQFFGGVLLLLFLAGWPWHEQPPGDETAAGGLTATASPSSAKTACFLGTALAAIAFAPAWLAVSQTRIPDGLSTAPVMPASIVSLQRLDHGELSGPGLKFPAQARHVTATYGQLVPRLRLDYVSYAPGHELLGWGSRLFNPARWRVVRRQQLSASHTRPAMSALTLAARHGQRRLRMRYVYRVGTHWTTSRAAVKAWRVAYGLLGKSVNASVLVVTAPAGGHGLIAHRVNAAAAGVARYLDAGKNE